MFSVTKFVVAGAILALFGGFLLTGVLTQQPSDDQGPAVGTSASASTQAEPTTEAEPDDTTTTGLLPGVDLVTAEVEPGVHQVLSDGVRDLVAEPPRELLFDLDGSLILFSPASDESRLLGRLDHFYTLGEPNQQSLGERGSVGGWFDAATDRDGTLIVRLGDGLVSFDGDTMTELTWPNGASGAGDVEAGPGGTVWVTRDRTGPWPWVARVEDGILAAPPVLDDGTSGSYEFGTLEVAPDGTVWHATAGVASACGMPRETKRLAFFDGEAWHEPALPVDLVVNQDLTKHCEVDDHTHFSAGPLAVGPEGTLWVYVAERTSSDVPRALLRRSDGQWTVFTEADGVPWMLGGQGAVVARLAVDGEGTLWIAYDGGVNQPKSLPSSLGQSKGPHGLISFDGSTWRQYLKGHHVNRVELAQDGSVWATSRRDCRGMNPNKCAKQVEGGGLYVITPEAVAGTE